MSEINDVYEFQTKFGMLADTVPGHVQKEILRERVGHLREEINEFVRAVATQDLAAQLDALIDLVYVAKGTAGMLGFVQVWPKAWDAVHAANMEKIAARTARHTVDVVKPADWESPNLASLLATYGYESNRWRSPDGRVNERKCRGYEK
jgi:predicted HAD superfamily Cof-like phosphohydrolase